MNISFEKQPLDLKHIINSDYKGFWLRLKTLGYKPSKMWLERKYDKRFKKEITFSLFTFKKGSRSIKFRIAKSRSQFITFRKRVLEFNSTMLPCFSWLEAPFLKHFKQKRPLTCLRTFERLTESEILKKKRKSKKKIGKSS